MSITAEVIQENQQIGGRPVRASAAASGLCPGSRQGFTTLCADGRSHTDWLARYRRNALGMANKKYGSRRQQMDRGLIHTSAACIIRRRWQSWPNCLRNSFATSLFGNRAAKPMWGGAEVRAAGYMNEQPENRGQSRQYLPKHLVRTMAVACDDA